MFDASRSPPLPMDLIQEQIKTFNDTYKIVDNLNDSDSSRPQLVETCMVAYNFLFIYNSLKIVEKFLNQNKKAIEKIKKLSPLSPLALPSPTG